MKQEVGKKTVWLERYIQIERSIEGQVGADVILKFCCFYLCIYLIEADVPEKGKEAWNTVDTLVNHSDKVLIVVDFVHPDPKVVLDDVEHVLDRSVHRIVRCAKSIPMTRPNNQLQDKRVLVCRQIVEGEAPLIVGCTLADLIDDVGHKGREGVYIGTGSFLE